MEQSHQNAQLRGSAPPDPARVAEVPPQVAAVLERFDVDVMKRVRQLRGARSQRAFARALGVFQQNVNRYENGTVPHPHFLVHLYLVEGVDLNWLLLGIGEPYRDRRGVELAEAPVASRPGRPERPIPPRTEKQPAKIDVKRFLPSKPPR